jgi:hypothetical protein
MSRRLEYVSNLYLWRQQTFTAEPSEQVPDPIVPNDVISCLFAASGVIAEFVNVLHAKRTGDFVRHNRSTQPVRSCSAKDLWLHDGINTVICGRNCCNPGTSVGFREASKTFPFAPSRGPIDKSSENGLVDLVRGLFLGSGTGRKNKSRHPPGLARLSHRF